MGSTSSGAADEWGGAMTAEWFGPSRRPLLGFVHGAVPGRRAPGVVICPPLARELQAIHYAMRCLADTLAGAGLIAVRFDYDGTGDSAGDSEDDGRVEAWLDSIRHAVALVRGVGATSVSLIGVRMGALLAELAARELADVAGLALWDPCVSGGSFVRQQRALQLFAAPGPPVGDELFGFPFSSISLAQLAGLTVPDAQVPVAGRALVLHRTKDPFLDAIVGRLGGAPVTCRPIPREEQLDVNPLAPKLPRDTIETLARWLVTTVSADAPPVAEEPHRTRTPRRWATVVADAPGGPIVERARRLGPAGLVGIETLPSSRVAERPTLLFLTTATDHRIGPNRLWVDLSRRMAGHGFVSVRFDASGIGDSPVRPGQDDQVLRAIEAFDDVLEVAEAVSPDDPSNVVLIGLCSGAYQALESALELVPRGVVALNPALIFTPPEVGAGGPMSARRQVCRVDAPPVRRLRSLLPTRLRQRLVRPDVRRRIVVSMAHGARRSTGDPSRWLPELVEGNVDVHFVCGPAEADELAGNGERTLSDLVQGGRVALEVVAGLDHALIPMAQRRHVADVIVDHLCARFAPDHPDLRPCASVGLGRP